MHPERPGCPTLAVALGGLVLHATGVTALLVGAAL